MDSKVPSLQDRKRWELTGTGGRMGEESGTEQQRNKGRNDFEDFEFFEDRTYLTYHTDICQNELRQ